MADLVGMQTNAYTCPPPSHVLGFDQLASLALSIANLGIWLCAVAAPAGLAG